MDECEEERQKEKEVVRPGEHCGSRLREMDRQRRAEDRRRSDRDKERGELYGVVMRQRIPR